MADTAPVPVWRRLGLLGGRSILILVLLALAVAALHRLDWRWDLTPRGRFTLDPALAQIIDEQRTPITVTAVVDRERRRWLLDHLTRICDRSPLLELRIIHPLRDQPRLDALEERLAAPPVAPSIYLLKKDRAPFRITVTGTLYHELQRQIGGALVTLAGDRAAPVHVLQGHGELATTPGVDACAGLLAHLALLGMRLEEPLTPARLSRIGRIPDQGLLIVPGPTSSLGTEASQALRTYLADGGAALILADHRCPADLTAVLARFGVFLGGRGGGEDDQPLEPVVVHSLDHALRDADRRLDRLVVDRAFGLAPPVGDHPDIAIQRLITAASATSGQALIMPQSAVVWELDWERLPDAQRQRYRDHGGRRPATNVSLVAVPTRDAWLAPFGDTRIPADEHPAQRLVLARALLVPGGDPATRPGRLVVVGSRAMAADRWTVTGQYANPIFLGDAAGWLLDRAAATAIPRQNYAAYRLDAEPSTIHILALMVASVIPCLCIGAAIIAWWERR